MQTRTSSVTTFGLAVGEGTGPELADIFERAIAAFADATHTRVRLERAPTLYRSFGGVIQAGLDAAAVATSADEDAVTYEAFVRELVASGGSAIFRTAFNAQPLYVVRERLGAVKVEVLPAGPRSSGGPDGAIMLVRDQAQGFYAGTNDRAGDPDEVTRTTRFSREATYRVLDFAISHAIDHFGGRDRIDAVVMAYKFHLLDLRFANWVADYSKARGIDVRVFQPDTMNRNLMRGHYNGKNVVVIGGNEWGDIMHADLLARAGLGSQDERCSLNVYLHPDLGGLREYQTVHGSADDIAGTGRVNPSATLRAAALMLETHAQVTGLVAAMEHAIHAAAAAGFATPDVGGKSFTEAVANQVIERTIAAWRNPVPTAPAASDTALLVIDMQRDFCAPDGRFGELGLVDMARVESLFAPLQAVIAHAHERRHPVFFVRTHADPTRLAPNISERHAKQGRGGYCAPGSPGAAFYGVVPTDGDEVVTKPGYDPFLGTDLEGRLAARGIRHLVLAGVFSDVCLDAAARTAFQKGFRLTVVREATLPLQRSADDVAAFMTTFYDANVIALADLADLAQSGV